MRSRSLVVLLALVLTIAACARQPSNAPAEVVSTPLPLQPASTSSVPPISGEWLSARQAVALAYATLTAPWKSTAKLAFVGRYSQFCNVGCSPLDVEEDRGISSDGRQAHWIVIFADETASTAVVIYVENGTAKVVKADVATIRPAQLFNLEGWVDSTEIQLRNSRPVGLELKTNDNFVGVDAEMESHPLLWLAETSFGRYDVYDAETGRFIKSR